MKRKKNFMCGDCKKLFTTMKGFAKHKCKAYGLYEE